MQSNGEAFIQFRYGIGKDFNGNIERANTLRKVQCKYRIVCGGIGKYYTVVLERLRIEFSFLISYLSQKTSSHWLVIDHCLSSSRQHSIGDLLGLKYHHVELADQLFWSDHLLVRSQ